MNTKPPSDSMLARAAQSRSEGNSWEVVGKAVCRSGKTVRRWPLLYPERWLEAMRLVSGHVIDDAASESVLVLRQLARSENETVRLKASERLIAQRLELRKIEQRAEIAAAAAAANPTSEAQFIAELMEAHSHDELIRFAISILKSSNVQRFAISPGETDDGS